METIKFLICENVPKRKKKPRKNSSHGRKRVEACSARTGGIKKQMRAAISRCMCENIISNSITVMPVAQPGHVIPHKKSFLQTSFIWGGGAVKQGNASGKFHTSSEMKPETRSAIFWFVGWSHGCDADRSNSFCFFYERLRCTHSSEASEDFKRSRKKSLTSFCLPETESTW